MHWFDLKMQRGPLRQTKSGVFLYLELWRLVHLSTSTQAGLEEPMDPKVKILCNGLESILMDLDQEMRNVKCLLH